MINKLYLRTFILFFSIFTSTSFSYSTVLPEHIIIYPNEHGLVAKNVILDEIKSAHTSIQMSIYQIRDADIVKALCEKSNAGLDVDVMYEPTPYMHAFNQKTGDDTDLFLLLTNSNVHLHQRPENLKTLFPNGHYHARYIILDNSRFLLTTGNFDETTFDHCRDFGVVLTKEKNEAIFTTLAELFMRDIGDQSISDLPNYETLIIGPHFQREKILAYLAKSTKNIKMYQQFFNDTIIREYVESLIADKGIKVEIVMMAYPTNYDFDPNAEAQDFLSKAGADVRLMDHLYAHARAVIIDDMYALIGTTQMSPPSLEENREICIVIEGPSVEKLVQQFKNDQQLSLPLHMGRERAFTNQTDWSSVVLNSQPI